jgi:putative ABC transport system permease protein
VRTTATAMRSRGAASSARWALRAYRGSAALLVATCAAGLAAALPVTSLVVPRGTGVAPTLTARPIPAADLALAWSEFARSPDAIRREAVTSLVMLLLGVAIAVLAVTWLTTLSASTARADARDTEIGVRRAVGAPRRTLLASMLLEGACVGALALALGCGTGWLGARLASTTWPGTASPPSLAPGLVAAALTLGAIGLGALFPLVFARRASQIAVTESSPVGLAIPAAQLGLSLTVLATAAMLQRGAARVAAPGAARPAMGEMYRLTPPDAPPAERAAAYGSLLRRLEREPAVGSASLASPGALTGLGTVDVIWSEFSLCAPGFARLPRKACRAAYYAVSADSFRAFALHLVAGRALTSADDWRAPRVAVISRSLAFPLRPRDTVGRQVWIGHGIPAPYTVVGVVDDRVPAGIGGGLEPRYAIYLSVLQQPATPAELLVRPRGDPARADAAAERAVAASFAPRTAQARRSEAAILDEDAAPLRWFAALFTLEGWALLAIAIVGTFAMMWLWVASLLGELGVHRAVGARRRRVMGYVLSRALLVAVGGMAFGSWLGMMVWDAMSGILSGLPAWDPHTVARLGVLLAVAAVAGAWLPARRATHGPPARLLTG